MLSRLVYSLAHLLTFAVLFEMTVKSRLEYDILPVSPGDVEKLMICGEKCFAGTLFRNTIFPKDRAHLTPPDELHRWRVEGKTKRMIEDDTVGFKAVLAGQPEEVIIGFTSWIKPGHFFSKSEDQSSVVPASPDIVTPKPDARNKEEDFPACMDVDRHKEFGALLDRERGEVWKGDANFWCKRYITRLTVTHAKPHTVLTTIGVDPAYQRQGIAGSLLQYGLSQADKQGLPVYLEATPDGALLYPHFGFESLGVEWFFDGQCSVNYMLRQPKRPEVSNSSAEILSRS